jgi:ribosomal protein S18 acetylase RimI-like enzyme
MNVAIRSMRLADAAACAAIACASPIGTRYGFTPAELAKSFIAAIQEGGELFVAELDGAAGALAGFAWVDARGAFSSAPYLRLIAVEGSSRGAGVGAALLAEFEARTASVGRDYCLLVSDFNTDAQRFYERHGYRKAGALLDFARPGITEILMVKRRGDRGT